MASTSEFNADPRGHYETLRLPPGAELRDVERAYRSLEEEWRQCRSFSRFAVQEAYRCLRDPERKAVYDVGIRLEPPEPSASLRLLILSGILLALLSHAGLVYPGFLRTGPPSFHPGDMLIRIHDQAALGEVSRQEIRHRFRRDISARAYLIRAAEGGERWYPAHELERHYRPATQASWHKSH